MPDENPEGPAPQEPAPPASDSQSSGSPWSSDLETRFEDEAIRSQVDEFLRETVQPHVTKIEQDSATNRDANRLWNDFAEEPIETYVAVTKEIFGDELASRITAAIDPSNEDTDPDPAEETYEWDTDPDPDDGSDDELDPRVAKAVDIVESQQREKAWKDALESVEADFKEDNPDLEFDEELFTPFVVATEGDFDTAVEAYKSFIGNAKEKFGIKVPGEEEVAEDPPPPVLDSDGRRPSTPPQKENYESLDDAMDAFFAEQKAPPPVTGS